MKKIELIKLVKESVQEITEQAYGHATLTSQGQSIHRAPGVWEEVNQRAQELADTYALHQLKQMRDDLMGDMEQEAEPEGGEIADRYGDQLNDIDQAIQIIQGVDDRFNDKYGPGGVPKSYDEVYLKDKLVGIKDAYEYDKGRITIYPDLGSLQYKSRATQEIVFTKVEGEIHFVRAFGYETTYYALKNVYPEIPPPGSSQYAGFVNIMADQGSIPVDLDTATAMVDAMRKGLDAERDAQSAFYTRQPGTGGTGIDEKMKNQPFPGVGEDIEEQAPPSPPGPGGEGGEEADKGTGQAAKKGPKPPKPKKHKYDPEDLQKQQAELLKMQFENMKVDIYNAKQNIRFTNKQKSTADPKTQAQMGKQIADQKKQVKQLNKSLKQLKKQISDMKKKKPSAGAQKEGFVKTTAKSLLNQYEKDREGSNLKENVRSHKRQARRLMLMEGVMKKFFEYFDQGNTNEEIVQLYAQKGVSVPEQFVSKARSQYENLKKLKLELETSEQNFKDVSKMMVNNATEEGGEYSEEKQLASGLTK